MNNRSISLVLPAVLCLAACINDLGVEPQPIAQGVLTTLRVPADISLLPGSKQQISVLAYDDHSWQLKWQASEVTYWSSNSAIASVDKDGLVTAIAPGTADIMTTLSVKGVTISGVTNVNVRSVPQPGTYRLTADITDFYSGWGEYTCCSFTALVTLVAREGAPLSGTFSNFSLIRENGLTENWGGGIVNAIDYRGQLILGLSGEYLGYWSGVITKSEAGTFSGDFNFGDATAKGSFTLTLVGS